MTVQEQLDIALETAKYCAEQIEHHQQVLHLWRTQLDRQHALIHSLQLRLDEEPEVEGVPV